MKPIIYIIGFNTKFIYPIRYPREVSQRSAWKANEWLNWLLYFATPILIQILPDIYFQHFQKLRSAIRILLKGDLNEYKLTKCEKLLIKFVKDFEFLYGQKYMVYNIHLLLHLDFCVRQFGPLWCYSLFPFENYNGFLKNYVKSANHPLLQINTKYNISHYLQFQDKFNYSSEIVDFSRNMILSGTQKLSKSSQYYFLELCSTENK